MRTSPDMRTAPAGSGLSVSAAQAKSLIPVYLEDTVRGSTKRGYRGYWVRYQAFCRENKISLQKGESISMFLISLAETTKGNSAPMFARNAIKYHLKLKFPYKKCATDSWFVDCILKQTTAAKL